MSDQNTNIAQAIQDVTERAQVLVREEIELAKAEVNQKVAKLAKGAAIGAAAGTFVLGALLLLLHGFAWLVADILDSAYWGFFVVAGVLLLLGALAGFLAARAFKAGAPPAPQMAIEEAKLIKETVTAEHPERTI
ncbi:MAG: phage holin family protein [Solirubrobacterales bacterium]|nr:phage holin family protein [Solirubrobacterales bacterium]